MKKKEAPVEATIIVNRLGTIEDVDDAACTLLGYSKQELVGLHGSDLIPASAQPATAVTIDRMRLGELPLEQQEGSSLRHPCSNWGQQKEVV